MDIMKALLATLLLLTGGSLHAQEIVRVAPVAPYASIDAEGHWSGHAIDLVRAAAERSGTDIVFVRAPSGALTDGSDVAAALPVFASPELPDNMDRSLPIARDSVGLLGEGGGSAFLSKLLGLFNWGFATVAGILAVVLLVVGTLFWLAERGRNAVIDGEEGNNGPLAGIGHGFWWAGVTATTIGYGDTVPKTLAGRFVAMIWMLFSMALTAVLTAYLITLTGGGTPFSELSSHVEGKRVAVVGAEDGGAIPETMLAAADSVRTYDTLEAARDALEAEEVDMVAHPYRALQNETNGEGIIRTNTETLFPMILVNEDNAPLRRAIDDIVMTIEWQRRLDEDH